MILTIDPNFLGHPSKPHMLKVNFDSKSHLKVISRITTCIFEGSCFGERFGMELKWNIGIQLDKTCDKLQTRWFKPWSFHVLFGGHNLPLKGSHVYHNKKVTKNFQKLIFFKMCPFGSRFWWFVSFQTLLGSCLETHPRKLRFQWKTNVNSSEPSELFGFSRQFWWHYFLTRWAPTIVINGVITSINGLINR